MCIIIIVIIIMLLVYYNLIIHLELNNGNQWYKLNFDNLHTKIIKLTTKYTPIRVNHNFTMFANPDDYFNIVFYRYFKN